MHCGVNGLLTTIFYILRAKNYCFEFVCLVLLRVLLNLIRWGYGKADEREDEYNFVFKFFEIKL